MHTKKYQTFDEEEEDRENGKKILSQQMDRTN
jgi:hypothetical protein